MNLNKIMKFPTDLNLRSKTPIVAFRRYKNIKDLRVHKRHINLIKLFFKEETLCEPCAAKMYKQIIRFRKFQDSICKIYHFKNLIICKTSNIFLMKYLVRNAGNLYMSRNWG